MKRTCYLQAFLLLAISFAAVSCDWLAPTPDPEPEMKIDLASPLNVSAEGGKVSAQIESNCPWQAQAFPGNGFYFITMVTTKGESGTSTLEFVVKPNLLAIQKLGSIQVTASNEIGQLTFEIVVTQSGAEPFAELLDWQDPLVPSEGGTVSLRILSNTAASLNCRDQGIRITIEDAPGGFSGEQPVTSKVTITVPANPKPEARSFNLELVCFSKPKMVTMGTFVLRQAAGA